MNKIVLRVYKISKKMKDKYNLECNYRYKFLLYGNEKPRITSAGIPNFLNPKEFLNDSLKYNKHKFIKRKHPLF